MDDAIERAEQWDKVYENAAPEDLPWYSSRVDADLAEALEKYNLRTGTFLDIGTGPGTMAIAAAERGFQVTAFDISPHAIEMAVARAGQLASKIDFRVDDILQTQLPHDHFDVLHDRGCFHSLSPKDWSRYVAAVRSLIKDDGYLLLKTFSWHVPGDLGPYRFRPEELRRVFTPQFEFVELRDSLFQGETETRQALFAVLRPRMPRQ